MKSELITPRFSLIKILGASNPKEEILSEIEEILSFGLKKLGITWNPTAFSAGLLNPDVPKDTLSKLEGFIEIGLKLDWNLPSALKEEFDEIIEDIEAFNPKFLKSLSK